LTYYVACVVVGAAKDNFENYPKGKPFTDRLMDLLGHGIFNSDGMKWKTARKTASQIFTLHALRDDMTVVFREHGVKLLSKLEEVSNRADKHCDMQDLFFKFTLDSISKIAFGVDLNCLDQEEVAFAKAFDECQRILDKRFLTPGWQVTRALSSLGLYIGDEGKLKKALVIVNNFANEVVEERKRLPKEQLETRTDLLSKFMKLGRDVAGNDFTNDDYRDIILNFIIAGRDTTAQNLSWFFYKLSLHPDVEEKCFKEVREKMGKQENPDYYMCVDDLKYLHAAILEALRLHPSVPKELKHAVKDDTLPSGHKVPAGTAVIPLIQALMRREEVWGADAKQYRPERWLEFESEPDLFKFPAFQAGPRTCLGKHMAQVEATYLSAMVLNKYRCKLVPDQVIEEEIALTLPARYGIMMTVEKREG
jgi:cytochrome P450